MGFRFRKSINLGGGFKINLSKSGVGYSWGNEGMRYTRTTSGKNRTSLNIPGTGISYVTESSSRKRMSKRQTVRLTGKKSSPNPNKLEDGGNGMRWTKFIVCLCFGYLGVHKFMEKRIGMGILYLFTMGLFGIGWLWDCVKYLVAAIKKPNTDAEKTSQRHERKTKAIEEYPSVEFFPKQGRSIKKILHWGLAAFLAIVAFFVAPDSTKVEEATPVGTTVETSERISIEPETIPLTEIEKISFYEESYAVGVGRTVAVPFILYPQNAITDTLEASVDNTEIAMVSLDEKEDNVVRITGITPGKVTITLNSGDTIISTKEIVVEEVKPEGIAIVAEPTLPQLGAVGVFVVNFDPQDVTNRDIIWSTDAPDVIKVNEDGSFEALAIGKAVVTATHECGVVGTLQLEVVPIEVESVQIRTNWEEGKRFCKNDTMTLMVDVYPEKATEKSIIWSSSDESVVTVSEKGVVKAISHGTAVITAEAVNGKQATYPIIVDRSPQKFKVSASISLKKNNHVGSSWKTGFEFNDEKIKSGGVVSIVPGDTFSVSGWAQENDSKPDYGDYWEQLTLTDEMCKSGFTIKGEAEVYENGGRYSGNCATWTVKIKFTPIK